MKALRVLIDPLEENGWGDSCQQCPLHTTAHHVVQPRGNNFKSSDGTLLIVGGGPSAGEDRTGVSFTDMSGDLLALHLKAILDGTGHKGAPIVVTNVVGCSGPSYRQPYREEMAACFPRLELIASLVRPSAILMLGAKASNWLAGIPALRAWRGSIVETKLLDGDGREIRGVATWHPAFLMLNDKDEEISTQFDDDVQLALKIARGVR